MNDPMAQRAAACARPIGPGAPIAPQPTHAPGHDAAALGLLPLPSALRHVEAGRLPRRRGRCGGGLPAARGCDPARRHRVKRYPSLLASVGHGAAMDIAGRGKADPRALLHTIALVSGDGISYKINSRKPRHHLGYNVFS